MCYLLFDDAKLRINFDMCKKKMRKVYGFNIYWELTAITFITETNSQSTHKNKGIPFQAHSLGLESLSPLISLRLIYNLIDLSVNFNSDNVGEVHHIGLDLVFDLCTALGDNL